MDAGVSTILLINIHNMFKLILNIRQSFLALYTFLGPIYITFIALPYKIIIFYCYLVSIADPSIFNILTPYLKVIYTTLDFNKSCLRMVLKI